MSIIALLVGQAINMILAAVNKGKYQLEDATPVVGALVDALGHATGETDEERAKRRTETEAIFAKHGESLLPKGGPP